MTSDTRGAPRGRRRLLVAALAGVALLAGAGTYVWLRAPVPEPPAVDLTGADPAAAAAVGAAREAVRRSPRSAAAWGKLGMVLIAHAFYPEANVCFAQAEQLDPREPRWPYYHGETLLHGDPDAAIPKLRQAAGIGGDGPAPRLKLAGVLVGQGRLDEAEAEYRRVLEDDPDDPWAQLGLGRVAQGRGRYADSVDPLSRAAASPGTEKTARLLLAEAHQRLGDGAAAAREAGLADAAPEPREWPDAWVDEVWQLQAGKQAALKRSQYLLSQGRLTEAVAVLRKTAQDYPDSDVTWLHLGKALADAGDLDAAEQALRAAVERAPDSAEARLELGVVLFRRENYREAAEWFRKAAAARPAYALAYYDLGHCLRQLGDRAGAIDAFRTALRCRPHFADAHTNLGDLLLQDGQADEARTHLRHAVELNPADERARKLLETLKR
jgi:tetratricopeptide (TPR) repeat protein